MPLPAISLDIQQPKDQGHNMPLNSLLSSTTIGKIEVRNRVVLAPLTRARAGKERLANALMAQYYAQRAAAGLLITEATVVSEQGIGWVETPGIYTQEMSDSWRQDVEAVHAKGAPIFLQLWHCGRASHSDFHEGEPPVAPSAIKIEGDGIHTPSGKKPYEVPRALETSELPGIVEDYRRAAEFAKRSGFDGVEVHSANGYLLDQFLQSRTNHRTDAYGGTIENRCRLLKEVVSAVCTVYESDCVAVRISPNGNFNDMGSPEFRELFTYVGKQLNAFGLAYLHVIDGLEFGFHQLGEAMVLSDFHKVFDGPLMGNCGYTAESAEAAIASSSADLIAFGRPFISNPDLVERFTIGAELNPPSDVSDWYTPAGAKGYTDFPVLRDAE